MTQCTGYVYFSLIQATVISEEKKSQLSECIHKMGLKVGL